MRDINRIDVVLKELGDLWKKQPDMRLGQLLLNLDLSLENSHVMWNMEEDAWLELIRKKNEEW